MATDNPIDAFFRLFSPTIKFPGSGDIGGFNYSPNTSWEAPALFRGNGLIEQAVYREVASPGTQLGVLIDAVKAIAAQNPALADNEAIKKLNSLGDQIHKTKTSVRENSDQTLRNELDHLKKTDNDRLQSLLKDYCGEG